MRRFAVGGLSVEGTGGSRCSLVGELWGDVGQDGLRIPAALRKQEQSSLFPEVSGGIKAGATRWALVSLPKSV